MLFRREDNNLSLLAPNELKSDTTAAHYQATDLFKTKIIGSQEVAILFGNGYITCGNKDM